MSRIELTAADRAAVSALLDWMSRTGGHITFESHTGLAIVELSLHDRLTRIERPTIAEAVSVALKTEAS